MNTSLILLFFLFPSIVISQNTIECFDANCETCTSPEYGNCTACAKDFQLMGGSCICYDPNCVFCYSSFYGDCEECKPNFTLDFGSCFCSIPHCLLCSENGCNQCENGYSLNAAKTECTKNDTLPGCYDQNCETCTNTLEGTCTYCKPGYYEEKGKCIQSANCVKATSDGYCIECPSGYFSNNGYCTPNCKGVNCNNNGNNNECDTGCHFCRNGILFEWLACENSNFCQDQNCNICKTAGYCDKCKLGYYKVNGKCTSCKKENCLRCDYSTDSSKCSICMNNYDLINGNCVFNQTSLDLYGSNKRTNAGIDPVPPYRPSDKPAEEEGAIRCNVDNCNACSATNHCASCQVGYEVKDGKCVIPCKVDNCESCSTENVCQTCKADYSLKNDNTCILECQDYNCSTCITSKWCIDCKAGYKLSGLSCTPICDDPHCSYCMSSSTCVSCMPGYALSEMQCKPCDDPNCQICSSHYPSSCNSCGLGHVLINGICAGECKSISHCQYCLDGGDCLTCENGCTLKNGKCNCFNYLIVILIIVIGIIIIGFGMFCYIGFVKKKTQENENRENNGDQIPNIVPIMVSGAQVGVEAATKKEELKEKYGEEFGNNRLLTEEREFGLCDYCSSKPAKYLSDCGCKLCKDHSKPVKDINQTESYKSCPVCMKIVNKIQLRKGKCGICLQDKLKLAKFKCHCALMVCKECYIKCKVSNSNCPACRKPIN